MNAQNVESAAYTFDNLINVENKKVVITHRADSAAYIIANYRNCEHCFTDLCEKLQQPYTEWASISNVYVIFLMKKDLLAMLEVFNRYSRVVPCAKDIYFLWVDDTTDSMVSKMLSTPTPQMITDVDNTFRYYSYGEVTKLIK